MTGPGGTGPERTIWELGPLDQPPPRTIRLPVCAIGAIGIGLLTGAAFTLPAVVYLWTLPGNRRTLFLLLAAACAILTIRRSGRLLRVILDATPQPWRLPLLGLYGLLAMSLPASLLLIHTGPAATPVLQAGQPAPIR